MFNKLVVVDVECAKAVDFLVFITLNIKLKRSFYVCYHTELKLYLFTSGQMQGFFNEVILRFERGERNALLCQRKRNNVVVEQKVLGQAFYDNGLIGITGLLCNRDIQLFAQILDHV